MCPCKSLSEGLCSYFKECRDMQIRLSQRHHLLGVAVVLSLLSSCVQETEPEPVKPKPSPIEPKPSYPSGTGTIQGIVLEENAGWALADSKVTLYQKGKALADFKTGADGRFTIPKIAAGTYDFKIRKVGMAGTDIYGYVSTDKMNELRIIQRKAFDPAADPTPPKLEIFRKDGKTLLANTTFDNKMDMMFKVAKDSDHMPPLRVMWAQLGRTPGSGLVQGGSNHGGWVKSIGDVAETSSGPLEFSDKSTDTNGLDFLKGYGSEKGEKLFIEFMAVDLNFNTVRYYVPVTYKTNNANLKNQVVAPIKAAATAITIRYQGGSSSSPFAISSPSTQSADQGSNLFVETRWCYTNEDQKALPYAFDIERSLDEGKTFVKVGTVGGGASKECPKNPMQRPFYFRDNGAALAVGKTAKYRVVARGANKVLSNVTQTTPLAEFKPKLNSPADEALNVPLQPIFKLSSNQLAIGADGVGYNLRLKDLKGRSGEGLPGVKQDSLFRVEEGTGDLGNKVPKGNALVFLQSGPWIGKYRKGDTVATDTAGVYNKKKPNLLPVNHSSHEVSIPRALLGKKPLQALRNYTVEIYSSMAYKYEPSEDDRISAYSVYTWPGRKVAPLYVTRTATDVYDFVTGTGKKD